MDNESGVGVIRQDPNEVALNPEIDEIQRSILSKALGALSSADAVTLEFPNHFAGEHDSSKLSYEGGGEIKFVSLDCSGGRGLDQIVIAVVDNKSPQNDISTGFSLFHVLARSEGNDTAYSERDISITRIKRTVEGSVTATRLNLSGTIAKPAGTFSFKVAERPTNGGRGISFKPFRKGGQLERLWAEGAIQIGDATLLAGSGKRIDMQRGDFEEIDRVISKGKPNKKMTERIVNNARERRKARVLNHNDKNILQVESQGEGELL